MFAITTTARRLLGVGIAALLVFSGSLATAAPAEAHPRSIPDAAFLQVSDLDGGTRMSAGDYARYLRPPMPCGKGRYHSKTQRRAEAAILIDYPYADFHTTLVESITRYRSSAAAARYLRELRAAVGRPRGCTDRTGRWTVVRVGLAGRGSMMLRLHEWFDDPAGNPTSKDSYLIVARVGRSVVMLADIGWEMGSGHRDSIQGLIRTALWRARAAR